MELKVTYGKTKLSERDIWSMFFIKGKSQTVEFWTNQLSWVNIYIYIYQLRSKSSCVLDLTLCNFECHKQL